ncbi:hypothetical protein AAG570_009350 [Ranatra chinensis]|uniref:THAP-type domain-containing protein n=1 Tax=Ranatra chinensis TaxID=642074 RepID=A0ABD0ZC55_9HEMI
MVYCVALGCINRDTDHKPGITFHRFPKDEEKRKAWAEAIQRQDLVPDDWSTVCSIHFLDEFLDRNLASDEPVTLKENAIPSLLYHQQFPTEQCLPTTKRVYSSLSSERVPNSFFVYVQLDAVNMITGRDQNVARLNGGSVKTKKLSKRNVDTAAMVGPEAELVGRICDSRRGNKRLRRSVSYTLESKGKRSFNGWYGRVRKQLACRVSKEARLESGSSVSLHVHLWPNLKQELPFSCNVFTVALPTLPDSATATGVMPTWKLLHSISALRLI